MKHLIEIWLALGFIGFIFSALMAGRHRKVNPTIALLTLTACGAITMTMIIFAWGLHLLDWVNIRLNMRGRATVPFLVLTNGGMIRFGLRISRCEAPALGLQTR
jgi:hypothetical protein